MSNLKEASFKKISFSKIGRTIRKSLIAIAKHPFLSSLAVFAIASSAGALIFYKYSSPGAFEQQKYSEMMFNENLYKKIQDIQLEQKKAFESENVVSARDPFK